MLSTHVMASTLVYYNESGNGDEPDWKKLLDVNSDDPNQSSLVLMEQKAWHLMVDHFTDFVLVGESAPGKEAVKSVKILAYFTPPKVNTDCVVRVYCVADTPAALKVRLGQDWPEGRHRVKLHLSSTCPCKTLNFTVFIPSKRKFLKGSVNVLEFCYS